MSLGRKDLALILSASLNVFFPVTGNQRSSMRAASSSLDPTHRAAFMELLRAEGQAIQAEARAARTIRDEAWASLAAPNFDPAATKGQLAEARDLNFRARRSIEDAVVDFSVGLSPAQRASFGQAMRRAIAHPRTEPSKERSSAP